MPALAMDSRRPEDARFASLKLMSFFVTERIEHPLSGKVIGGDRSRVKGLARLVGLKGSAAKVVLTDVYEPIAPGDIARLPHFWHEGKAMVYEGDLWAELRTSTFVVQLTRSDVPERSAPFPKEERWIDSSPRWVAMRTLKSNLRLRWADR